MGFLINEGCFLAGLRTANPLFKEGLFVFNGGLDISRREPGDFKDGELNISRRDPRDLKESFLPSLLKLFLVLVIARFTVVLVSDDRYIPRSSTKSWENNKRMLS